MENLIAEIKDKTGVAHASNLEASEKQASTEKQATIIVEEKTKADEALMEALPAVEAASDALNNIRREDLQELKAFNNPPIHVKIVCQMCTVLRPTGEKLDNTWADSKKMLGNPKLLDLLKTYPKNSITDKMHKSCRNILKENKHHDISIDNLETKSRAGKGLLVWVLAILRYYEVAKNVEPLRGKVREMEKAQARAEADLSKLRNQLNTLEIEILSLHKAYNDATTELSTLQTQAAQMQKRLIAASKLVSGLAGEKKRWSDHIKYLNDRKLKLLGDCLLRSSFLSYFGAFNASYRHDILKCLYQDIQSRHIPVTTDIKVDESLISDVDRQNWIARGLPADDHSIENGILTTQGTKFPLCIDPQMQASFWIKRLYENSQLYVKAMTDSDFMKYLELAIQFGKPFLFENVEHDLDPLLDPILLRNFTKAPGTKTILLGDKHIEWDNGFRLFLCTRLSNPYYPPGK